MVYPYRVLCYSKTNILSFSASYQLPEAAIHTFCEQCQKSEYVQVKCVLTSTSSEKMVPLNLLSSDRTMLIGMYNRFDYNAFKQAKRIIYIGREVIR